MEERRRKTEREEEVGEEVKGRAGEGWVGLTSCCYSGPPQFPPDI